MAILAKDAQRDADSPDDWRERIGEDEGDIEFPIMEYGTLCLLEAVAARNSDHDTKPISTIRIQNQIMAPSSLVANWVHPLYSTAASPANWPIHHAVPPPLSQAFQNVTNFTAFLDFNKDDLLTPAAACTFLNRFLLVAHNLRKLTLYVETTLPLDEDLEGLDDQEPPITIFDKRTAIWPHIQYISLSATVNTTKLIPFLKLHASTLRSLELRQMIVGDVPELLERIPKTVSLDHVFFQSLFHIGPGLPHTLSNDDSDMCILSHGTEFNAPYEKAMKDYLLGKVDRMPDLMQDDLGQLGGNSRTDRLGPPPDTVFNPHSHDDHKHNLMEF